VNGAAPAEQQPRRQPRIFMIPPVVPMAAKALPAEQVRPIKRRPVVKRAPLHIPASQFGRVRALANYGMTQAQVAELYGFGVDEIERIVGQPAS
jgi:hypothetical protein